MKWSLMIPDAGASLALLRRKGFMPKRTIDIGAFIGDWTTMLKSVWPESAVLMCEAQDEKKAVLDQVIARHKDVQLRLGLLSDVAGREFKFNVRESGSSMYDLLDKHDGQQITLVSTTLSEAVRGTPFENPDMVKIDVQGAELAVMRGGLDVIKRAEVVMLEASLIEEFAGAPLFPEVMNFMSDLGFAIQDICTIWRNTPSGSVNELDVIFARKDSQLFDPKHYRYQK
ncbi:MAG TPA: FkbM family methyltransferase [Tepidisphaeraceae bacterium]|nr:FkbM family methyltransferase [Tepidisphaeraceae bacterium]